MSYLQVGETVMAGAAAAALHQLAVGSGLLVPRRRGPADRRVRPALIGVALIVIAASMVGLAVGLARWHIHRLVADGARLISDGEYSSAARTLLPAVALAPGDPWAHFYLGEAYSKSGRAQGAVNHLAEAVRLAPREARFHDGLGQAYRAAGAPSLALREFREVLSLRPGDADAEATQAGLLVEQGHAAAAAAALRQALRLHPRSLELRLLLATVLRQAGDREGMLREYEEVARRGDSSPLGEVARRELSASRALEEPRR